MAILDKAMNEPTARQVTTKFLTNAAEFLTNQHNPRGCLVVQGALSCSAGTAVIQQELIVRRKVMRLH